MNIRLSLTAILMVLMAHTPGLASEANFLRTIEGDYTGKGTVKLRTNRKPIGVRCKFRSSSTPTRLSLNGSCTGLLVISRKISASLSVSGSRYRGTYVGAGTGPASLSGKRRGSALTLNVRWAKEVNGDRDATLTVRKVGVKGLTLTTVDRDPKTGKLITTSEIVLTRR